MNQSFNNLIPVFFWKKYVSFMFTKTDAFTLSLSIHSETMRLLIIGVL